MNVFVKRLEEITTVYLNIETRCQACGKILREKTEIEDANEIILQSNDILWCGGEEWLHKEMHEGLSVWVCSDCYDELQSFSDGRDDARTAFFNNHKNLKMKEKDLLQYGLGPTRGSKNY